MKLNIKYQLKLLRQIVGKKYINNNGIAFGIDKFGKSAPYKNIFNYFGLNIKNIIKKTTKYINR